MFQVFHRRQLEHVSFDARWHRFAEFLADGLFSAAASGWHGASLWLPGSSQLDPEP
jgi:hypothetical protein